jgi:acetylornithine/N-succinyldiaminopimelate aminotransferase
VTTPDHGEVLARGDHGSTFAGAPVTARAALAALEVIDDAELLARVDSLGERFRDGLTGLEQIEEVRGRGLMVGVTVSDGIDASDVAERALEAGLVINVPGPSMLRFLPPLVIDEGEVDEALALLSGALG